MNLLEFYCITNAFGCIIHTFPTKSLIQSKFEKDQPFLRYLDHWLCIIIMSKSH